MVELILKFECYKIWRTFPPSTGSCDIGYQEMMFEAVRMGRL